jgi:hypothetical protein
MSANDDAGSERNGARLDDDAANFVYTGQENVPDGVIRVRVHPSIKVIRARAFFRQSLLINVELHDGIEVIEKNAFEDCRSLREILFPPSVREIKWGAFCWCSGLTTAILNDGLEEIGEWAFKGCALVQIVMPPSVRAIKTYAFYESSQLTTAILNDGLEEIGARAFRGCALVRIDIPPTVRVIENEAFSWCSRLTIAILNDGLEEIRERAFWGCALVCIDIPPSVKEIDAAAFEECSNLTTVQFCDEIEEFVSGESMRHWWNRGVHEKCLSTYSFFVRCNISERVGLLLPRMWQSNIHDMLGGIPSISSEGLYSYFRSIDSKLSVYDKLKDSPALLELAIWKSKIIQRTDGNIDLLDAVMKIECRTDSLSMVAIIVPNVLSFLG